MISNTLQRWLMQYNKYTITECKYEHSDLRYLAFTNLASCKIGSLNTWT